MRQNGETTNERSDRRFERPSLRASAVHVRDADSRESAMDATKATGDTVPDALPRMTRRVADMGQAIAGAERLAATVAAYALELGRRTPPRASRAPARR